MKMQIETVTPERAREYLLSIHPSQRKLSDRAVQRWKAIIKNGEFMTTHQGIAFDENGYLIDGQHRMAGCAESGIPITVSVTRGLDESIYGAIDGGMTRSLCDRIGLNRLLVQEASCIAQFSGKILTSKETELVAREIMFDSESLHNACGSTRRGRSSAPIRASVIVRMYVDGVSLFALPEYRHLVLAEMESMAPSTMALFKWLIGCGVGLGGAAGRLIIGKKASYAFRSENAMKNKLRADESLTQDCLALVDRALSRNNAN